MPRRALLTVATLLALLHLYIGLRLVPAMALAAAGVATAVVLLAASALLGLAGVFSSILKRSRWSEQLTWAGLISMGFFSSLLVLTLLRDAVLLVAKLAGAGHTIDRASAYAVPLLAVAVTAIGFVNARRLAPTAVQAARYASRAA
jgi:hypothetical protein